MKKQEQEVINNVCNMYFNRAIAELPRMASCHLNKKQLREAGAVQLNSCQAWVWDTPNYVVLQSYDTFVACIPKAVNAVYDVLRMEYGYTHTSSMHIVKFARLYGVSNTYTAR